MPIRETALGLQRRLAPAGRIRAGRQETTSHGRARPVKLDRFRLTSPRRDLIEQVAALYGGDPAPWDPGARPQWEVVVEEQMIPVTIPPGMFSQWMETWSGGGCVHRCDGEYDARTGLRCRDDDPAHAQAKPTTRISVMLPELGTMGVWRLDSHGWNAAAELPAITDLAARLGDYVPAVIYLDPRVTITQGQTRRYYVPVLDIRASRQQLLALTGQTPGDDTPATAPAPEKPALPAPAPAAVAAQASTVEECQALWRDAAASGRLDEPLRQALSARARELTPAQPDDEPAPAPEPPGDPAGDDPWLDVLDAAWQAGWDEPRLYDEITAAHDGTPPGDLTPAQLTAYARHLRATHTPGDPS